MKFAMEELLRQQPAQRETLTRRLPPWYHVHQPYQLLQLATHSSEPSTLAE